MRVVVGFSDHPETAKVGRMAALEAVTQAGRDRPCDAVLLFSTSSHDPHALRTAVAEVVGHGVLIVGGGAVGVITNDCYGYAGDQIALAAVWLEGQRIDLFTDTVMPGTEHAAGERLGVQLRDSGVRPETPVVLFYDAIDTSEGTLRLVTATHLLSGLRHSLGFLPHVVGAGFQGDYQCTPTRQWIGREEASHAVMALASYGRLRMDTAIMHGCRPATAYYTVTKADGQTILEINGRPAIPFLHDLLGKDIPPEKYPFFLILGVNGGDKWAPFEEDMYASRLCFGLDTERQGIIMFEPDMVAGTEFQIMYRSMDLAYMEPRIEALFEGLGSRRPVFALYINCAGRAAGYAGNDMEDALVVQKTVAGRVPLLGLYTGVEIGPVQGVPRGLDWTGVFCLFSEPQ